MYLLQGETYPGTNVRGRSMPPPPECCFGGGIKVGRKVICNDANGPAVSCLFCYTLHGDDVALPCFA